MKPEGKESETDVQDVAIDKNERVTLKVKDDPKREQSFPIAQANAILNLRNSQWELSDSKFKHNGKEIAKK